MNLIDKKVHYDNNCYFCTWQSQGLGRTKEEQLHSTKQTRDFLTEESSFGKKGTATMYPRLKKELIFLFDDGWDVGYGLHIGRNRHQFGSLIVNDERFPSCTGEPVERLKKLNDLVKKSGWRGLGIWICSNACGETVDKRFDIDTQHEYWRERIRWSKEAGVLYWKVDWGHYERDASFRRMLNEIAAEEYPELVIEQAGCCQPLNGVYHGSDESGDTGLFMEWNNDHLHWLDVMSFSQVFRTYDVINHFAVPTTLDRVYHLLRMGYESQTSNCVLNCEDEMYIGAALGLNLGIMRSKLWRPAMPETQDPTGYRSRITEVYRAMNWLLHFAPVMGINEAPVFASNELLTDSHYCDDKIFSGRYAGKTVRQSAPSVIARGCMLPEVSCREAVKPYIIASRNRTGAYSLASLCRKTDKDTYRTPLADTEMFIDSADAPIGIFGYHGSVTLKYPIKLGAKKVFMQDLNSDEAEDITSLVEISGNKLVISGELITKIGTAANFKRDNSEPGVVIKLV